MAGRIYVGNLPWNIKKTELCALFQKFGRITEIDLKIPSCYSPFAFVTFAIHRDAQEAIHGRHNYTYDGSRLRVEFPKRDNRCDIENRETSGRRTKYGVIVSNLPRGCTWQDLKDFMRKAGDVVFADVERGGDGVVEFSNKDDMEYAIKSMDDTEFKSFSDTSVIRVKAANKKRDRSRSRSPKIHAQTARRGGTDDPVSVGVITGKRSHNIIGNSPSPNRPQQRSFQPSLATSKGSHNSGDGIKYQDDHREAYDQAGLHSQSRSPSPGAWDDPTLIEEGDDYRQLPPPECYEEMGLDPSGLPAYIEEYNKRLATLDTTRALSQPDFFEELGLSPLEFQNCNDAYETIQPNLSHSRATNTSISSADKNECNSGVDCGVGSTNRDCSPFYTPSHCYSTCVPVCATPSEFRIVKSPVKVCTGRTPPFEFFASPNCYALALAEVPWHVHKAVFAAVGWRVVDKKYDPDYLVYKKMAAILRHTSPAARLRDALIAFYRQEWRQQGPTDSLLPRYFFGVAAPSGTGKTQMAFTLKAFNELNVVHIVLAIDGTDITRDMQRIYLHGSLIVPSLYLNEAISWDFDEIKTVNSSVVRNPFWTPSAEDLLPGGCCRDWQLHTVVALSLMFNVLDREGKPFNKAGALRARLWEYVGANNKGSFSLPVLVVDEALFCNNANSSRRCGFLRTVLRAVGIASLFMGTNVEILKPPLTECVGPERAVDMPWVRLVTLLPRTYPSENQRTMLLAHGTNATVVKFFRALEDSVASSADSTQCFNALFMYRLWEYFLKEPARTIDELRSQAAEHLYGEKHLLRSVAGISAQLLYCLGEAPQPTDAVFIHCHFARLEKEGDLDLTPDNKVVLRGTNKEWAPLLAFASPAVDPLGPLLLGGVCTSKTHPTPFKLFTGRGAVTLTAAMAVRLHREREKCISVSRNTTSSASDHENYLQERAMAAAAVCASQASGINGVRAGDFLLYFAAELLPRAPEQPLQWDLRTPLETRWSGTDTVIPFCSGATTAVYPPSILPNIGRYDRQEGVRGVLRDCHETKLCTFDTAVHAAIGGGGKSSGDRPTLSAAVSHFLSHNVPLGVVVVSPLEDPEMCDARDDTHVVKLVVDQTKGTVSIEAVGGSDRAGNDVDIVNRKVGFCVLFSVCKSKASQCFAVLICERIVLCFHAFFRTRSIKTKVVCDCILLFIVTFKLSAISEVGINTIEQI